jgi:hypothetical protein
VSGSKWVSSTLVKCVAEKCGWQQKCGCKRVTAVEGAFVAAAAAAAAQQRATVPAASVAVAAFARKSPVVASATGAAAAAGAAGAAEAGSHTNLNQSECSTGVSGSQWVSSTLSKCVAEKQKVAAKD